MKAAALRLDWRPFRFELPRPLVTAHGAWSVRQGWLLRLQGAEGGVGWGEAGFAATDASAVPPGLGAPRPAAALWALLGGLPAPFAFALGQALLELERAEARPDSRVAAWLAPPASALLLPAGEEGPETLRRVLAAGAPPPALKWKVAAGPDALERRALEALLSLLPAACRLRLDANGGWDRPTAAAWAERLVGEPRLEWLEQPLAPADGEGLVALARRIPVALDESVRAGAVPADWPGWQVRRPAVEGDPRGLLAALRAGTPRLMISTAFETGIGWRLVAHLAALQQRGPTPTAPGLAPGWRPRGGLFAADPARVWEAAA